MYNVIKTIRNTSANDVTIGGVVFTKNVNIVPPLDWWLTSDCFRLHRLGSLTYTLTDNSTVVSLGETNDSTIECVADSHDYFVKYYDILKNLALDFAKKQDVSQYGFAALDSSGKIPLNLAPVNLLGAMKFQGTWNATSDTITTLKNAQESSVAGSSKGMYWIVSVAGSTNMSGETDWKAKDWIIWDGTAWSKVDNTDSVVSVAGQTGVVVLTKSDVGLGNVENTSDANKPVSTAQQTALNLKANLASPTFTGTVSGITKAMVGLSNVDNTTDALKPISTATQTALNGKANTANTLAGYGITDAVSSSYGACRAKRFIIGDGVSTSFALTHNFNNSFCTVSCFEVATGNVVIAKTIVWTSANVVTVTLNGAAVASNFINCIVQEAK